ncbi:hypothetical protein AB0N65_06820 [Paenarthrobacter sp. NPDC089322]|uniref:hypothetical protein n=1 Tax=Paenarthrobacter sp. NPDC089322 TaxID=3155065 RepID=UPI00343A92C3
MTDSVEFELPQELEGQTSINDFLPATPAIIPVELREPTDLELAAFLSTQDPLGK